LNAAVSGMASKMDKTFFKEEIPNLAPRHLLARGAFPQIKSSA